MRPPLKGYCYPLTPSGTSSLVGPPPWHYATEYLNLLFRADPDKVAPFLPEPLEPGPDPGLGYVAFSQWWSLWQDRPDLAATHPERTQYREAAVWVGCSYRGRPGQICLFIWVDNDFSLARGWFMGFPKRLGAIEFSEYHPLNPLMPPLESGTVLRGAALAHGERLMEGTLTLRDRISPQELPFPLARPLFHIRHFPSIEAGALPSVLELVELGAENVRFGEEVWRGEGTLRLFPSDLEEHTALGELEVLEGYHYHSGYTFPGGKVLHRWS